MLVELLPAERRNRWSPALLPEIDFSAPTFHCFLGIEREEEISTTVTREERPRGKLRHSRMSTKAPSAAAEKGESRQLKCLKPARYLDSDIRPCTVE